LPYPELLDGRKRIKKAKEEVEMYPSPPVPVPLGLESDPAEGRATGEAEQEEKKQDNTKGHTFASVWAVGDGWVQKVRPEKRRVLFLSCMLSSIFN
jgi:hypothetical protein